MQAQYLDFKNHHQRAEYERFVRTHPNGSFFQSLCWADVKNYWDKEAIVIRKKDGSICGTCLILIKKLPAHKTLLYAPRGPLVDCGDHPAMQALIDQIHKLAKRRRACMFRADPCIEESNIRSIRFFELYGFSFTKNPEDFTVIQGRNNYVLDIKNKTEEELLAGFHPKWRYNIRLAARKGVRCVVGGREMIDDFYTLLQETGARDHFLVRSKSYFQSTLKAYGENARLYMCYYGEVPLSGAIAIQYASKTYYVHGASSNAHRNLMPNYLMQWEMIKWAIKSGCALYDFMGIPCYHDESHPNYGVYRFKKGFNGRVLVYAGEFDLLFSCLSAKALRWYFVKGRRLFDRLRQLLHPSLPRFRQKS